jgi:hypothetical protein
MNRSIAALADKFIQDGIESQVMARSAHWSILKQDRNGTILFAVWPISKDEEQEFVINLERQEVYGYAFDRFDDAVNAFARVLTHKVTLAA